MCVGFTEILLSMDLKLIFSNSSQYCWVMFFDMSKSFTCSPSISIVAENPWLFNSSTIDKTSFEL